MPAEVPFLIRLCWVCLEDRTGIIKLCRSSVVHETTHLHLPVPCVPSPTKGISFSTSEKLTSMIILPLPSLCLHLPMCVWKWHEKFRLQSRYGWCTSGLLLLQIDVVSALGPLAFLQNPRTCVLARSISFCRLSAWMSLSINHSLVPDSNADHRNSCHCLCFQGNKVACHSQSAPSVWCITPFPLFTCLT